jgi:hypothetical protein
VGAAERARGALVPEPGLEAGAVEEVAAGEAVHHGPRPEPGQAHAAVVAAAAAVRLARRRRRRQHLVQRRPEGPEEPLRQSRARRRQSVPAVVPGRQRGLQVQEHQRRPHQPRQRRDRDHRVVHQVPQQAVPRLRHARDPHRRRRVRFGDCVARGGLGCKFPLLLGRPTGMVTDSRLTHTHTHGEGGWRAFL